MKEWLEKATASLNEALAVAERGEIPQPNTYKLAPIIYSDTQHMNNNQLLDEMADAIEERVKYDCSVDDSSKEHYRFHFVSSYLYCFVVAGKIDEMKYDRIMDFVAPKMDLFA